MLPVRVSHAPPLPVFKCCPCRRAFRHPIFVVIFGAAVTWAAVFLVGYRANNRSDEAFDVLATTIFLNDAILFREDGFGAPNAVCIGRRVCPATETEQGSEAPVITEIFHRNARCGAQEISLLAF